MGKGRKSELSEEEQRLFREATADVRPLPQPGRVITARAKPDHEQRRRAAQREPEPAAPAFSDPLGEPPSHFHRGGLQSKLLRRLRTGDLPIEAILDLHGMRLEEARVALARFIDTAQARGQRCLLLIHGKGYGSEGGRGVLRHHALHWLSQHPALLAYTPAQARDGGEGALYLLIRRSSPEQA